MVNYGVHALNIGSPSAPTGLVATENGLGSLNITWSLDGVAVLFTLTATNPNASPIVVSGIPDQYYIFTVENVTSCDIYSFQVIAVNDAGSSDTSEIITRSLPSIPEISAVENSLSHSLAKTADGITLTVTFEVHYMSEKEF